MKGQTVIGNNMFFFLFFLSWFSTAMVYGGLNTNSPHRVTCMNAWPTENGTFKRCGLVWIGMALLEQVYHCGASFKVSYAQAIGAMSFDACRSRNRTLSYFSSVMSACMMLCFPHDENGSLSSEVQASPREMFSKCCCSHGVSSQQ